ncbi:jg24671 [Pararge aegeria aegeria]|uniref:Jg24671 protein n=1 Tax=Pararge aegeria aegeria TaxID=348720 RepID=A0A8S4QRW4_9NEOP|nr:jg24671 [Pararge aegeria aegeria]
MGILGLVTVAFYLQEPGPAATETNGPDGARSRMTSALIKSAGGCALLTAEAQIHKRRRICRLIAPRKQTALALFTRC